MHKKPVILDCDTGTDDAIAIIAALSSPELDVRAITTVAGNAPLEYTSRNTLNLVRCLGRDTKVAVGAARPLVREAGNYSEPGVHGPRGLGSVELPETSNPFYDKTAVETIYEEALGLGGELSLVPTGPLTNIALAILTHPDLRGLIRQIVFMGGAMVGGNVTPSAEFNMWADPEAARVVLASGILLTMVGLDVTRQTALDAQDTAEIRASGSPGALIAADILDFMLARSANGGEQALMHDALAVGVFINPRLAACADYFVDCECSGEYTSGHTMVDRAGRLGRAANCWVAESLDVMAYKQWIKSALCRPVSG